MDVSDDRDGGGMREMCSAAWLAGPLLQGICQREWMGFRRASRAASRAVKRLCPARFDARWARNWCSGVCAASLRRGAHRNEAHVSHRWMAAVHRRRPVVHARASAYTGRPILDPRHFKENET
ncbi:hypothetical protein BWP39_11630 [Paraburkholderia acidicola]|uniref:Uncharacterized protein n=1 Tax=Paraburkholderia acidicola TaxID=1912599 RepID=A0A2A4EYL3_9BURK|nr:hypothetical protein BWP39_11630 [Paraburkholderia acidicola]